MTDVMDPVANGSPTVRATVSIGMGTGTPLPPAINSRLLRVVVDNDAHLPGMFELTFLDLDGTTLPTARISIGTQITVSGSPAAAGPTTSMLRPAAGPLIVGEVTAIEGLMQGMTAQTVVRGYTAAHRLQRTTRSRTFLNSTDADIARQIATQARLQVGTIVPTTTTHAYLPQVNQTDWEFLKARANEIGFEVGVQAGLFYFRPAAGGAVPGGGLRSTVTSAVSNAVRGALGVSVKFPDTLISFRPRVSAGNLTPDVEVRVWDPMERRALAQIASTPAGPAPSPASLGGQFASGGLSALAGGLSAAASAMSSGNISAAASSLSSTATSASSALSSATGGLLGSPVGYLGPPPSPTARVVSDRPMANGYTMATTGPLGAAALGSDLGSTYAEAEGDAAGNPAIQPGVTINVTGVPVPFAGAWKVSRARHIFDDSEHGYRTTFAAHGRQDRSMLGLTSGASAKTSSRTTIDGVVCGVVSNCGDPLAKSRVKVTLPWLSPTFETDWAPVAQFCSGPRTGAMFLPEVGDEVLVAFEFGDPRRPYVLGGMINNFTTWNVAKYPISAGGGGLTQIGATAGSMAGSAYGGPVGSMAGGAIGGAAMGAMGAAVMSPGMVSEVRHRGFVSSTGNCLLFYDHPLPLPLPTGAQLTSAMSAGSSGGMTGDATADAALRGGMQGGMQGASTGGMSGGGMGGGLTSGLTHPGLGALASAVRLGSQGGEVGLTIDLVNGGVDLKCDAILGVTTIPIPTMNITVGPTGTMTIDGGLNLSIKAAAAITIEAPTINLTGAAFANGLPII